MKKLAIIIPVVVLLFSCNPAEEAAQNSANGALESLIESQTGQEVDFADVGNYENNAVKGSFLIDGQEKITDKTKMVGTVTGSKDTNGKVLSFQFQNEEGTMIMIVISPLPDDFSLPFTAKMYKQNEAPEGVPAAIVTFMKVSENGMFSYLSFDGTLTIQELNQKKASLTINGKGGDGANLEAPEKWNDMKASFSITSPIIQTMGFDKSEIIR